VPVFKKKFPSNSVLRQQKEDYDLWSFVWGREGLTSNCASVRSLLLLFLTFHAAWIIATAGQLRTSPPAPPLPYLPGCVRGHSAGKSESTPRPGAGDVFAARAGFHRLDTAGSDKTRPRGTLTCRRASAADDFSLAQALASCSCVKPADTG